MLWLSPAAATLVAIAMPLLLGYLYRGQGGNLATMFGLMAAIPAAAAAWLALVLVS